MMATQLSGLLHLAPSQPVTFEPPDERTLPDNCGQENKSRMLGRVSVTLAEKVDTRVHALPPEGLMVSFDSASRSSEALPVSKPVASESQMQGPGLHRSRDAPTAEIKRGLHVSLSLPISHFCVEETEPSTDASRDDSLMPGPC